MNSNSQMHSSQINSKSPLSTFIQDLETFENAYTVLLNKAKEKYIEYDKYVNDPKYSHWDYQRKYLGSEFDLSRNLLEIFRYFVDVNIMRLLFDWPAQTEDSQIEKMFSIFFNKVRKIQLKLAEIMRGVITIKDNYNEFADIFLSRGGPSLHNRLDEFLISLFKTFGYMDMEREIMDVLRSILTSSKGLFPINDIYLRLKQNGIKLREL